MKYKMLLAATAFLAPNAFADPASFVCTVQHGQSGCVSNLHPCTPTPPELSAPQLLDQDTKLYKQQLENGSYVLQGLVTGFVEVGPREYSLRILGQFDPSAPAAPLFQFEVSGSQKHVSDGSDMVFMPQNGKLTLSQNTWKDKALSFDQADVVCAFK